MYNEETKEKYLSAKEADNHKGRNRQTIFFNKIAPYEERLGKDLGQMTKEEIISGLQFIGGSYSTIQVQSVFARQYLLWYDEAVAPVRRSTTEFSWDDVDLTETYRRDYIRDIAQIGEDWSQCDPNNGDYIQPYLVLIWYGFSPKDFLKLKKTEVEIGKAQVTLTFDGVLYTIDDQVVAQTLRDYNAFTEYQAENSKVTWHKPDTELFFYNKVSKDSVKVKKTVTSIDASSRLQWYKKHSIYGSTRSYDYASVRLSGLYHRVIELQEQGAPQEEIETLMDFYGVSSKSKAMRAIFQKSLESYRKAFDL